MSRTATISLAIAVTVVIGAVAATSATGSGAGAASQEHSTGGSAPGAVGGEPAQPSPGMGTATPPCGTTVTSGTGPNASVGFTPCPGDEPPVIRPQIVEPMPGMADVHPIAFDSAKVGEDDRTVTIDFVAGVEPCSVLDHVDVSYAADAVTITLFEGHDPDAGMVACPAIAMFKRTVVVLDEPLDGRALVDGAIRADQPA